MQSQFVIVISSCDLYCDCWEPLFFSIEKYWPDCPYPIYLISNFKDSGNDRIKTIKVGEHLGWGSNTIKALKQIDAEYIIYFQEDFFLNRKVDRTAIENHLKYCVSNSIDYLRLGPPYIKGETVSEIYKRNDALQRSALCLQTAIWKTCTLSNLLFEGWTGWDFEYKIQSYIREQRMKLNVMSLKEEYSDLGINYVTGTGVRKGRWTRPAYAFLKEAGFTDLLNEREVEGYIFNNFQEVHGIFRKPALAVVKLMKIFKWNF